MQIHSITSYNINKNNFYNSLRQIPNFYGVQNYTPESLNTAKATDTGEKILADPERIINLESLQPFSEVTLKQIHSVPQFASETACIASSMDINGNVDNIVIYIPELFGNTKIEKTIYIMNFAHEYTHYLQMKNKEDANHLFYKNTLKNDLSIPSTIQDIYEIANLSYKYIGKNLKNRALKKIFGDEGRSLYEKTGGMILTNTEITPNNIAQALGFKDADDFRKNFKNKFRSFDVLAMKLCTDCTELRDKYRKNPSETLQTAKEILAMYCKHSAKDEKEAYMTENNIAHIQGFSDRASELAYKFNALVESAL